MRITNIEESHSQEIVKFGQNQHQKSVNILKAVHAPYLDDNRASSKDDEVDLTEGLSFSLIGLNSPLHPRTIKELRFDRAGLFKKVYWL